MRKYKLNYDWDGFGKGSIFIFGHGDGALGTAMTNSKIIDLLVLSGALSPVEGVELLNVELLNEIYIHTDSEPGGGGGNLPPVPSNQHLAIKINEIIRYLKALEK